jgi:hypothetical protein
MGAIFGNESEGPKEFFKSFWQGGGAFPPRQGVPPKDPEASPALGRGHPP